MHSAEKQKVISAIGDLGRRVTPADVATKTGLPLLVVQQELNRVASETDGHLQVGSKGDVVYSFAPGFSTKYVAKGIAAVFLAVTAQVGAVLYYLLRISFGLALILSLIIGVLFVILIAIAMMMAMKGRDGDRDGGFDLDWLGGGGFHFTFWDWMILRDILFWNSMSRSSYRPTYSYDRPTVRERPQSNFLLNCFSFLFGDGDPNEGLEEKRWQLIAQVIKRHNNVLTAEQLAPYTGADPKNEDAVLPVLVRFNGRPEVTTKGNIVYVFESMQPVATTQKVEPPPYLQEFPWKFSNVPDSELVPVYVVAALNFLFIWFCWNFQGHLTIVLGDIAYLSTLFNVLLGYAIAFVAVPLWRAVFNAIRNARIDARNIQRFRYAQIVQHPSPELAEKLAEAATFKVRDRQITDRDIVFTTEKDARDQDDELSERFKQMEGKQAPRPQQDVDEDGRIINVNPEADGKVINIKRHAEEFDASP